MREHNDCDGAATFRGVGNSCAGNSKPHNINTFQRKKPKTSKSPNNPNPRVDLRIDCTDKYYHDE